MNRLKRATVGTELIRGEATVYGAHTTSVRHSPGPLGGGFGTTYRVALYDRDSREKIAGLRSSNLPGAGDGWVLGWGEPHTGRVMVLATKDGAFSGRPNPWSRYLS